MSGIFGMKNIATDAIGFTMSYGGSAPSDEEAGATSPPSAAPPVNDGTPIFRGIHFSNIFCVGARRAVHLEGLPEMPIASIDFRDLTMSSQEGFDTRYAKDVRIENVKMLPERGPAFVFADSTDVTVDHPVGNGIVISGAKSSSIHLLQLPATAKVTYEKGASAAAVQQ